MVRLSHGDELIGRRSHRYCSLIQLSWWYVKEVDYIM